MIPTECREFGCTSLTVIADNNSVLYFKMKKKSRIFTKTKLTDVPYYLLIHLPNSEQDIL